MFCITPASPIVEPDRRKPAPLLEQHTRQLLRELEFEYSQIDALIPRGNYAEP